jgi:uncharacterized damage-inducible protein DinB
MTVTVPEVAAQMSAETAETLIAVASATPADRLTWQPLDQGRTILEQLAECAVANRKWAAILRTGQYMNLPEGTYSQAVERAADLSSASALLREATAELVAAIRSVPVDRLAETIDTEWGPYAIARCCFHANWNMTYHEGQINYVQTLYGDYDEHEAVPTT